MLCDDIAVAAIVAGTGEHGDFTRLGKSLQERNATASPARRIRPMPSIRPPAMVKRSASPISAGVSSSKGKCGNLEAAQLITRAPWRK